MRKLLMVLRVSIQSVIAHKMRSFLTMLGVVIGVAAVIALVAVGEGARAQVVNQFTSLGSNLLVISPSSSFNFRPGQGGFQQTTRELNTQDVSAIRQLATAVSLIAPTYSSNGANVTYAGTSARPSITGVTAEYATVRNWTVTLGRFITTGDEDNVAMVAVLGSSAVEDLFGSADANPIGEVIRINRQNYQVVGVLKSKGDGGMSNQDNVVFIPMGTAQLKLGGAGTTTVNAINLQVRSAEEMRFAQAQVTAIIRTLHEIESTEEDDFTVQNQADILSTVEETTGTFTTLLASISAISLVVGGIGIMNIMLVSVTERTREIGLRKAVGAKHADLLIQFLAEAIVLSVTGGLIGVGVGIGAAQIITPLMGYSQALVTASSVALALGVSLGIGVFFGFYPANRAAGLNPIDALRYE
jgi:putative ABC transport system permease protein